MKVYSSPAVFEFEGPVIATMGTFDGVHLGHKTILQRLKDVAHQKGGESLVVTYHPHPRIVLMPEAHPVRLLQTLEERIVALESFGIDKLLIIPFTLDFSKWSSDRFIQEVLLDTLHIHHIIIGYDHHFGHDRRGGLDELRKAGIHSGFEVEEIPAKQIEDNNVSSTRIRKALASGDLSVAAKYLGYPYQISGKVVHGDHRGRLLGYPTANLEPLNEYKLIPCSGVYAVEVDFLKETYYGMMNIGVKPTFGGEKLSIEVHLFNFNLNLYHEHLTVRFIERIREEQRFTSLDALKEQLAKDQEACYRILQIH